jgi:hypothetical protein
VSASQIRILEGLLERVLQRAHEPRQPGGAPPTHLAIVDDAADGLDINLVDDFPSSTALAVADVHEALRSAEPSAESASRLIASETSPLDVEPPPRHTPPPESGPLRSPPASAFQSASGKVDELTGLRPREDTQVRHIQANLSAVVARVEVRGTLPRARFVDMLDATLGLKP